VEARGDLADYYAARADEYERVYAKPERQADLLQLRDLVPAYFRGRRVLEIACGTGYWTALIAPTSAMVLATDVTPEVLAIARAKQLPPEKVQFQLADAYALSEIPGVFDAGLAGFWWSHVPRDQVSRFLDGLHRRLGRGARVMFLDNRYVGGSSTAIARTDRAGNTYQRRRLMGGAEHEVLKNFPSLDDVRREIGVAGGTDVDIIELQYYWVATYQIGAWRDRHHANIIAPDPTQPKPKA